MAATWQNTGTFPDSRSAGGMIKLPNGKVLYVGGYNSGFTFLSTCALFNPLTNTWAYTGSLTTARAQAGLVLLNSGLVLAIGGNNSVGTALSSCELYDPNTGLWTTTGSMSTARTRFANFLLGNGTVLVAGGGPTTGSGAWSSSEIYDPGLGTWSGSGSMSKAVFGPAFGLLGDGRPIVSGGINNGGSDPGAFTATYASGTWTTRTNAPAHFYCNDTNPTAVLPSGDVVFMCPELAVSPFGASVDSYIFRVADNTWDTIDSPSTPHAGSPYILTDGSILLAGGLQPHPGSNLSSDRCDILDPDTETWTQVANLPYAGELTATGSLSTAPVLDDGTPLWACPEIDGGTIPTSNSSLLYQETITMAETKITGSQMQDGTVGATQLASTAVTAGSYTLTSLTVDADGRITAASNGTASTPAGVILQTQVYTTTDGSAHNSSTFTNSDLAVAITPASSSNKILVTVTGTLASAGTASPAVGTLYRDTTNLAGGTNGFCSVQNGTAASTYIYAPMHLTFLDSPATTSAITYRLKTRNTDNTTEVRTGNGGTLIVNQIMVQEIKG